MQAVMKSACALLVLLCAGCERGTDAPEPRAPQAVLTHEVKAAASSAPGAGFSPPPVRLEVKDTGIFSDLDDEVTLTFPSWVIDEPLVVMRAQGSPQQMYAYLDGAFVGLGDASLGPVVEVESFGAHDLDGDGIPDSLDVMVGARKTELNAAPYIGGYEGLAYPGGDVARDRGVCTDVVIRAVRNAGMDLQVELHEDIKRAPGSFPMVKRADPHIDQRRVKTILPYFKRHWRSLPTDPRDTSSPWLPGDVLFMQTMGDARPDHMGIVSDKLGVSGLPEVINNWTDGSQTSAMDFLSFVPVTHRFRLPTPKFKVAAADAGLAGVLKRQNISLPAQHEQVVLVTAAHARATQGALRRYERVGGSWRAVGKPVQVQLGARGLGRGLGLHDAMEDAVRMRDPKREGDERSPAGVFGLGTAFGREASLKGEWPYRQVTPEDRFVDDPASPHYNTWQRTSTGGKGAWASAEAMKIYHLGLVVEHNMSPSKLGMGSAIFLHTTRVGEGATLGCTSMAQRELRTVLEWLEASRAPVLVQVAGVVF